MRRTVLLGIDYSRASLAVREGLAFTPAQCADFYAHLSGQGWRGELIIFSTCNRSEFLLGCPADTDTAEGSLLAALRAWRPAARALDDDCVRYRHADEHSVRHAMRVASGLASRVKGDAQVAQQFRQAAELSQQAGRAGPVLNPLVSAALRAARRVRRETGIGCGAASTGAAVLGGIRSRFGDCQARRVLLLGAGQVAADTLAHLSKQRFLHLGVAARRTEAVIDLTRSCRATPVAWDSRETEIQAADAVIAAVSEPLTCLQADALARIRGLSTRPLLLIDLGVPRAVDPLCQSLPGISLLDLDRIQAELAATQELREAGARQAETIVGEELARFVQRERQRSVEPAIRALYHEADQIRRRILATPSHDPHESTRRLMKGLLDGPVRRLRQLAATGSLPAEQAAWVLTAMPPSAGAKEKREAAL